MDVESFHCEVCELAKHHHASFPISNKRTSIPFSLIHGDVWGPSKVPNISRASLFVVFIDYCTHVSWIFLLKQKSYVSRAFPNLHNMIKTQFGVSIKKFRSNNAQDYFNQVLSPCFTKEGIIHESSCISTPPTKQGCQKKK